MALITKDNKDWAYPINALDRFYFCSTGIGFHLKIIKNIIPIIKLPSYKSFIERVYWFLIHKSDAYKLKDFCQSSEVNIKFYIDIDMKKVNDVNKFANYLNTEVDPIIAHRFLSEHTLQVNPPWSGQ